MIQRHVETQAGFIGNEYPAFLLQYWPADIPRGHVIYLPAFAEEMNRCRSIVAEQARWFAGQGLTCSILDFYGTGESQGELCDATLPIWKKNVDDLVQALLQRYKAPITLWGCRIGALIALDYIESSTVAIEKVLLWQPVVSGKTSMTQMLRQKIASMMERGEGHSTNAITTDELRAELAMGNTIDIAGYVIGGELVKAIDGIEIQSFKRIKVTEIFWLEHNSDGTDTIKSQSQRAIRHLDDLGAQVNVVPFTGQPLWQLHKRDKCENLLERTRELGL